MKVFDDIGSQFGTVIQSAQLDEQDGDLSYARVGILTKSMDRVNQRCKLSWKNRSFVVLVEEEVGEWTPDCLVDLEDEVDDNRRSDDNMTVVDSGDRSNERDDVILDGSNINDISQNSEFAY
ncbi:hypothetical protein Hanom_Chr03g00193691 [Helianthus anomalus]